MRARTASGALVRVKSEDPRDLAPQQPGRRELLEKFRLSERAESNIGRLNLLEEITNEQYTAGRRYAVLVGSYLAMANAPRGTAGSGRAQGCAGELNCPADTCRCLALTRRYMDAYEAVSEAAGRRGHMALNHVVIWDRPASSADQIIHLKLALQALAEHLGLTNQRKH